MTTYADTDISIKAELVLNDLNSRLEIAGVGRNRIVFKLKNNVLKFPLNEKGMIDNGWEHTHKDGKYYPKTKIILIGNFPCLIMEYAEPLTDSELKDIEWASYVDCGQVGRTSKGKIIIYDYGIN